MTSRDAEMIKSMAHLLRCHRTDLNDERAVMRVLQIAYRAGEVMALHEAAIDVARKLGDLS